ncbi:MAG: HEXXH motif-containing putative peptide modification protein [Dongiaceae bacterium]
MRARLAASLRYIADQAAGAIVLPATLDAALRRIADAPVSPLTFGAYCDLVLALEADQLPEAAALLAEIAAAPAAAGGPAVRRFGEPAGDRAWDRYRRLVDTDPAMPFTLRPAAPAEAERAASLVDRALALIAAGNPELGAEIRALIQEIVLAAGADDPDAVQFDGVSSFLLWGGVVLNARSYDSPIAMVQALAHESGHNLLFGLSADGPLQDNDDADRFASPLRTDPRPMDGIVHAVYVTARMHQAVQRLLEAGILGPEDAAEAAAAAQDNRRRFAAGIATVDRHARLTPLGTAVLDGARRYMAAQG